MKRLLLFSFLSLFTFTISFSQASGNTDLGSEITNGVMTDGCVSSCSPTYCTQTSDNTGNHSVETIALTITGIPAGNSVEIVFTSVLCGSTSGLDSGDDIFIDGVKVFDGSGNADVNLTECVEGGADILIEFTVNRRDEIINVTWDSGPTDPGEDCFSAVVPVEFGMVEARTQENKVNLYWETHAEINNEYFEVQWSRDGSNFQTIGDIEGAGNSTDKLAYTLLHDNPVYGQNMYRIKQVDFDGNFEYSDVVTARVENDNGDVVLTPSPVKEVLYVSANEELSLEIFSLSGARVLDLNKIQSGTVDLSTLQAGIYIVRMKTENEIISRKIIKQ